MIDRPLAAHGFTSYRYQGPYGAIMIGATDTADALNEAKRSLDSGCEPDVGLLQVWSDGAWEHVA